MAPVLVEIGTRPMTDDEVQVVDDLDDVVESVMCSCNAGDNNPY